MPRKSRPHKAAPPPRVNPPEQRRFESRTEDLHFIQNALSGDDTAYKNLMNKYHDAIFHFIYRIVRDRHQVEDLTQEAFIKAFSSLRSFNNEYAFSTWLYKIATNNSIDYIRRKKLQMYSIDKPHETGDSDYTIELPDETYETDRGIIRGQRAQLLMDAIANLPEKYKKVIHLRHTEEKSYEEIAKILKLPIGTVKAHIFRAREMLYKHLKHRIRNY